MNGMAQSKFEVGGVARSVNRDGTISELESGAGSHFCFGNDLTQKNKVESIIPGEPKFTPSKLEVWAFGN